MIDELVKLFEDFAEGYSNYVPDEYELPDGVTFIDEVEQDHRRWVASMLTVVDYKGQLFGVEWDSGLTEYQENEFYPDKTTIYPVEKFEKTVYDYRPVVKVGG